MFFKWHQSWNIFSIFLTFLPISVLYRRISQALYHSGLLFQRHVRTELKSTQAKFDVWNGHRIWCSSLKSNAKYLIQHLEQAYICFTTKLLDRSYYRYGSGPKLLSIRFRPTLLSYCCHVQQAVLFLHEKAIFKSVK